MYAALDISKWFLCKNIAEMKINLSYEDGYEGITNLKLQKLLYYAQGIYLSLNNKPLFAEPIEAWKHGPVVQAVYQEYKNFGRENIEISFDESVEQIINKIGNDKNACEALELTYNNFAIYTAWQLRNMTHEEDSPWHKTYYLYDTDIISNDLIKEYFSNNVFED